MCLVKEFRVGQKRIQAGPGAEIDRPPAIFGARIISGVRVVEDPSTEGDEAGNGFLVSRVFHGRD